LTEISKVAQAEAAFKSSQKDIDQKWETREHYDAQLRAMLEKTARLRALRLARDAEVAAHAPPKRFGKRR
jgi:hypothetical protein